jgi:TP901 family phage tail tape measure protein
MTELRTSVVIDLAGNLTQRAQQYGRSLSGFSQRGQRDLGRMSMAAQNAGRNLDGLAGRTAAIVAGAGAAYAGYRQVIDSAQLDKKLINIQQTAGATAEQAAELRKELFLMSLQTGQSIDSLMSGFNTLIQGSLSWAESLQVIKAINPAMAVTGSRAEILSSALTAAGEHFDFDLSKLETSVELLDKMTTAGRAGFAELEDLSGIFARVGPSAAAANLSFDQTLGLIERMSKFQANPERLSTLIDSTLRIFTNQKYQEKASKATGLSFYDADGERRAAFDVLDDISAKFQKFKTGAQRDAGLAAAFGEVDLDTMRGLRVLLSDGTMTEVRSITNEVAKASGTINKDLPAAIENAVDQVSRLKSVLKEAADGFAQPINDVLEDSIKYLIDKKEDGGLGLSGGELLAGGAAGILGGALLLKGSGKLLGKLGGLGAGVAVGKGLEELAGVQPVYVVNMPGMGFGSGDLMSRLPGKRGGRGASVPRLPAPAGAAASAGALGRAGAFFGTRAVPVAAAASTGWLIGEHVINPMLSDNAKKSIGRFTAQLMAALGSEVARAALDADPENTEFNPSGSRRSRRDSQRASLEVRVSDDRVRVVKPTADGMDLDVSGSSMLMP